MEGRDAHAGGGPGCRAHRRVVGEARPDLEQPGKPKERPRSPRSVLARGSVPRPAATAARPAREARGSGACPPGSRRLGQRPGQTGPRSPARPAAPAQPAPRKEPAGRAQAAAARSSPAPGPALRRDGRSSGGTSVAASTESRTRRVGRLWLSGAGPGPSRGREAGTWIPMAVTAVAVRRAGRAGDRAGAALAAGALQGARVATPRVAEGSPEAVALAAFPGAAAASPAVGLEPDRAAGRRGGLGALRELSERVVGACPAASCRVESRLARSPAGSPRMRPNDHGPAAAGRVEHP